MSKSTSILVADGGSTKVDWALIQNGEAPQTFHTSGLNPFIINSTAIAKELQERLVPHLGEHPKGIDEIYFYGAGCSSFVNCEIVKKGITEVFEKADVIVDHDMLGAVKALFGDDKGIACILGTGSNCCVYDGEIITNGLNCLGHLAGDQGSGNHMGKLILQSYCYGTMPENIRTSFIEKYNLTPKQIVAELYDAEKPNAYLASFTKFLKENIEYDYSKDIIRATFEEFIIKNVFTLDYPKGYNISFTGSVAFYFQDILKELLGKYNLPLGRIIRKPIQGMIEYHTVG
ncbi:MAG: glucosamine kinase [Maribacter sp.]|jgi:glucosamine kinase